jgi:hypothetical protein
MKRRYNYSVEGDFPIPDQEGSNNKIKRQNVCLHTGSINLVSGDSVVKYYNK